MTARVPHTLVVTADGEDRTYRAECPGVTDDCRLWLKCGRCPSPLTDEQDERLEEEQEAHGEEHQRIAGEWMTPTTSCYVAGHDELSDAAFYAVPRERELGGDSWGRAVPGRYQVTHDVGNGTELELFVVAEDGAS